MDVCKVISDKIKEMSAKIQTHCTLHCTLIKCILIDIDFFFYTKVLFYHKNQGIFSRGHKASFPFQTSLPSFFNFKNNSPKAAPLPKKIKNK
jgi:hypothetical protein